MRSMVLKLPQLERLTAKPQYENIVVGTGVLAKDMRKKLQLLGLKAPFFIGFEEDLENDVRSYKDILSLGDSKTFQFVMCCDDGEWDLHYTALPLIHEFLGLATMNHPQVFMFSGLFSIWADNRRYLTDAANGNTILKNSLPYTLHKSKQNPDFYIHFIGNCHASEVGQYSSSVLPFGEALKNELDENDFHAAIYSWGQPNKISDNIVTFLRDICSYKCDLLILFSGQGINSLEMADKNLLSTSAGSAIPAVKFYRDTPKVYNEKISNGINHDIDLISIRKAQQRVLLALSGLYGFDFWDIIPPTTNSLPENQAEKLGIRDIRKISRQAENKHKLLSVLDNNYTKDYSDVFDEMENIFPVFLDSTHLTAKGNIILAKRFAADILKTFNDKLED